MLYYISSRARVSRTNLPAGCRGGVWPRKKIASGRAASRVYGGRGRKRNTENECEGAVENNTGEKQTEYMHTRYTLAESHITWDSATAVAVDKERTTTTTTTTATMMIMVARARPVYTTVSSVPNQMMALRNSITGRRVEKCE